MRAHAVLLFLLLVPGGAAQTLRLEGFSPNLPGGNLDDVLWIRNLGPAEVPLDGVTLEDNTGRIGFPPSARIPSRALLTVAGNGSAYRLAARSEADYALEGAPPGRTLRLLRPDFALSQQADVIRLLVNDSLVDTILYGEAGNAPGWTGPPLRLIGSNPLRYYWRAQEADTDTGADFRSPRERRLGQLATPPEAFAVNASVLLYTAPENSRAAVQTAIELARERLRINVYQFRDLPLAERLAQRARDGIRVEVLLDERPVGESTWELSERGHVVEALRAAGASVRFLQHQRYGYDHAKYMVIDEEAVLVQTENFVPSGIPDDGREGNRGWGALVPSKALARALARVFDDDFVLDPFGARLPADADAPRHEKPVLAPRSGSRLPPTRALQGTATLLVAPDGPLGADDPILRVLRGAAGHIRVAQLNLPFEWPDGDGSSWPHPYLTAILDAARRGVRVQVLLDGHFVDEDGEGVDNLDTKAALDRLGIPHLEVRIVPRSQPVLHAKGVLVDDRTLVVGSMNWNRYSVVQNREVTLVLEGVDTSPIASAFEADWAVLEADATPAPGLVAIIITALLVVVRRASRKPP